MILSGLIGENITYSYSKEIHNLLGNNGYEIFSVDNENDFKNLVNSNFSYFNITIPYKFEATKYIDVPSLEVTNTNVCNTLIKKEGKIYGYNTDVFGFEYLLKTKNIDIMNKRCLILGTGATSKSVAYVLNNLGASSVKYFSRNPQEDNQYGYQNKEVLSKSEIIINTTPTKNEDLIDFKDASNAKYFIDVCYNPLNSKMIISARKNNIASFDGLKMLVAQAYKTYCLYSNKEVKTKEIEKIYRKILKNHTNIILIGHTLAGKSKIGKVIAKKLDYQFVDIDAVIGKECKLSINEIFSNKGEEYFRKIEKDTLEKYLFNTNGLVISTGGGAIINEDLFVKAKNNSWIINLYRPVNNIRPSLYKNRPLVNNYNDLEELINQRKDKYIKLQDYSFANVLSINKTRDLILEKIL